MKSTRIILAEAVAGVKAEIACDMVCICAWTVFHFMHFSYFFVFFFNFPVQFNNNNGIVNKGLRFSLRSFSLFSFSLRIAHSFAVISINLLIIIVSFSASRVILMLFSFSDSIKGFESERYREMEGRKRSGEKWELAFRTRCYSSSASRMRKEKSLIWDAHCTLRILLQKKNPHLHHCHQSHIV